MNWIPEIMAAGQGELNSPDAQKLGRKLWLTSSQGKYIVDQVKYFKNLDTLSRYLDANQNKLQLLLRRADKYKQQEIIMGNHHVRLNVENGYKSFVH